MRIKEIIIIMIMEILSNVLILTNFQSILDKSSPIG